VEELAFDGFGQVRIVDEHAELVFPCSALHEKLALVTRRKRWSTARNFAWLRA